MAKNTVMSRAQEMAKEAFKKENLALSALGYGVGKLFPPFAIANGIYNIGKIGYGLLDATPKSLEDMMDNNNPQEIDHYAYGPITAADQYGILNDVNSVYNSFDVSFGDLDPASTDPARAEYETAINAMEYPDNPPNPADFYAAMNAPYTPDAVTAISTAPFSTPNYAPDAVSAISTLAGIGSGLLGSLQGKDEFGVYGQASDFATNAADENSFEGYDGSEFGGSGSLGTSYGGMEAADFAAGTGAYTSTDGITEGLVGTVESLPSTVASVGEVGDPAAVSGGFPGATPGFSSLSQHNMSARDFMAMVNMSDANSMAARSGNAWNAFAGADSRKGQGYNATLDDWANFQSGGTGERGANGQYGGDPGAVGGQNAAWAPSSDAALWAAAQDSSGGGEGEGTGDGNDGGDWGWDW